MEIVIGAALLSVVMLPVIMAFGAGSRGIELTRDEFILHNAGLELMEQLLSLPADLIPLGTFTDAQIQDNAPIGQSPLKFQISDVPDLTRELEITAVPKTGPPKMKKIDITVTYQKKNNRKARSMSLKTLLPYDP